MKRAIGIIISMAILAAAVITGGCTKSGVTEDIYTTEQRDFMEKNETGIYLANSSTTFTSADSQTAINKTQLLSRMQRDDMSIYANYVLAQEPEAGKNVTVTIEARGVSLPSTSGSFMVLKKSSGKVWLWDKQNKAGHLILWE